MTMAYIFLSALIIMIASLAGVAFVNHHISNILKRNLKVLIAFSTGVFAVLVYSLFSEVLEIGITIPTLIFSALSGAMFLEIIDKCIPHTHNCDVEHKHGRLCANRMLIGDAVHNISDGIILVPAFLMDIWIGVVTTAVIFLHEFVQEIAEFFVLKEGGYTTRQALTRNFLASSTIFIGVIIALFALSIEALKAPLIAFGAGGFLFVILRDLLPDIARSVRKYNRVHHFIAAALIGAGLMWGIQLATPHTHEHAHGSNTHGAAEHADEHGGDGSHDDDDDHE